VTQAQLSAELLVHIGISNLVRLFSQIINTLTDWSDKLHWVVQFVSLLYLLSFHVQWFVKKNTFCIVPMAKGFIVNYIDKKVSLDSSYYM
jgi:hypothetical protein